MKKLLFISLVLIITILTYSCRLNEGDGACQIYGTPIDQSVWIGLEDQKPDRRR